MTLSSFFLNLIQPINGHDSKGKQTQEASTETSTPHPAKLQWSLSSLERLCSDRNKGMPITYAWCGLPSIYVISAVIMCMLKSPIVFNSFECVEKQDHIWIYITQTCSIIGLMWVARGPCIQTMHPEYWCTYCLYIPETVYDSSV
jgi:hypothetical protein